MSIRESARIQVHHFLQQGLQQYEKGSEPSLEAKLPVLQVDRGLGILSECAMRYKLIRLSHCQTHSLDNQGSFGLTL